MTRTPGRATVDRSGYAAYIQSAAWRRVRQRYIDSKLPKVCAGCGVPWGGGDHLHHRTYKNLGCERLMDLVPLCQPCHRRVHDLYDSSPRWRRKGLWFATKEVCKKPKTKDRTRHRPTADQRMGVVKPKARRVDWPGLHAPVEPPSFVILPPASDPEKANPAASRAPRHAS
jgi:hypothetical protein